jgi:hypothetical protein
MPAEVFRRYRFSILTATLTALAFSTWQAAGSFQMPSSCAAGDGVRPSNGAIAKCSSGPGPVLGSCGKGRISDTRTHACHGPADIQGVAP